MLVKWEARRTEPMKNARGSWCDGSGGIGSIVKYKAHENRSIVM